jgi:N-acetylglucosaminyldiphosphoundecaprenol N-acetyl-beta-D-mannosaminyltransferase
MSIASYSLLGVRVHPLTAAALTSAVVDCVHSGRLRIIANHNLHSLYLHRRDERFRAFYRRAYLSFIDGMSIILAGRLLGLPVRREHRVTYVDWMDPLMATAAASGWKVVYLGAGKGIAGHGAAVLRDRHPGLVMETMHGFFDPSCAGEENRRVVQRIRAFEPQVLMVGMGMPNQEHWILDNLGGLPPCVVLTAGAAIAYAAGVIPTPPRWAGRLGMEWLFRLIAEPRRLWKRYLVEPWSLLGLLVRELVARLRQPHIRSGME